MEVYFSCFFPRFVKVDSLFKIEMGCSKYWQTNIMENISCEWGVYILVSVQVAGEGGSFHHAVESLSHYHDYDRNMQRPWQYTHINFWPLIHDVWILQHLDGQYASKTHHTERRGPRNLSKGSWGREKGESWGKHVAKITCVLFSKLYIHIRNQTNIFYIDLFYLYSKGGGGVAIPLTPIGAAMWNVHYKGETFAYQSS